VQPDLPASREKDNGQRRNVAFAGAAVSVGQRAQRPGQRRRQWIPCCHVQTVALSARLMGETAYPSGPAASPLKSVPVRPIARGPFQLGRITSNPFEHALGP
jgi:hypothetical protein